MERNEIIIKKLTREHLDQYHQLLRYAFQITEEDLLEYGWEDEKIIQSKFSVLERANVLGGFHKGELVSQLAVYPLDMNIYSEIYSIGFITSVATYPEYTGMKIMSRLIRRGMEEMKASRQSLALLFPYYIPFYRKRGWEIISDKMSFVIKDSQLPQVEAKGVVRRVAQNSADLVNLHTRFARQTHGCLLRDALAWEEYWRWDLDDISVGIYYDQADCPMGYMVYLVKNDVMHIKEMIYLNMDARKGLWKFIKAHESMIDEVRGNNFYSETLAFSLEDADIKETIRPYVMGRIVDFEEFLQKYHFRHDSDAVTLTLHISDPLLEWNNRPFTIEIRNGRGKLTEGRSENQAKMSIGTLTTLLLGYKQAATLAKFEMLEADGKTIGMLDAAVFHDKPYISDYI